MVLGLMGKGDCILTVQLLRTDSGQTIRVAAWSSSEELLALLPFALLLLPPVDSHGPISM